MLCAACGNFPKSRSSRFWSSIVLWKFWANLVPNYSVTPIIGIGELFEALDVQYPVNNKKQNIKKLPKFEHVMEQGRIIWKS